MVTKHYEVTSCIICVRCGGRMFKVDDSYGEYFECLACSHTVDIKVGDYPLIARIALSKGVD